MFPKKVEQWRSIVTDKCQGFDPNIILALIQKESGGQAGVIGRIQISSALRGNIKTTSGGKKFVDRALGLMQTVPVLINAFARANPTKNVTYETMIGKTRRSAGIQIAIGCNYLATQIKNVHKYDPVAFPGDTPAKASLNQVAMAVMSYAIGWGNVKKRLTILKNEGKPLTLESLADRFPRWGYNTKTKKWVNRPIQGTVKVMDAAKKYGEDTDTSEPKRFPLPTPEKPISLALIGVLLVLVGYAIMENQKNETT